MKEADIRPADIHAEYLRLSAVDADRFFPDRSSLVYRPCPGCGADQPAAAFTKHGFDFVRCGFCDSLYVTPCPTATQLAAFYTDSPSSAYWAKVFFPAVAEARRARIFRPRVERVLSLVKDILPSDMICEVGAGAAIFLEELRRIRPELSLRAVEPGFDLARNCRAKGFDTFEGFAADAAADASWRDKAGLVACFEVIEHTPDTLDFMIALAHLAKPGGVVLVSGLCGDGFDIRVLGARANAIAPPHHLTFLSRRGIASVMERAGLVDCRVFTPGELDVDIVVNAMRADEGAVSDLFLRSLLLGPNEDARTAFQTFLKSNGLSSHMWAFARKP